MTKQTRRLFEDSLVRCTSRSTFLRRFYQFFTSSSPEIVEMFENTDWLRLNRMVVASFHLIVQAYDDGQASPQLESLARLHRDKLGVTSDMFDTWLDCLLRAVREHDPEFDDEVEASWRAVMGMGIAHMRAASRKTDDGRAVPHESPEARRPE